nr:hypothetical protein TnSNPV_89 [Trichoplusia ni single nucleopolyhedrovirus]
MTNDNIALRFKREYSRRSTDARPTLVTAFIVSTQ